jgi:hypothetical protein
MRFMMLVKASKDSEAGVLPTMEQITEMGKFNEELIKAGILLAADGLQSSAKGARVRFDGAKRTVSDGPFTETKELLAGYWVIQVKSRDEAIAWATRIPFENGEEVEVRQVFEAADFGPEVMSSEDAAKEQAWRDANQQPIKAGA